jgi:biopolymer transport protein ExbB/TolQ
VNVVGLYLKKQASYKEIFEKILISIFITFVINIICVFFPEFWANLLIGKLTLGLLFTFQDLMWILFVQALLELRKRALEIKGFNSFKQNNYLPEHFEDIIDDNVLTQIIRATKEDIDEERSTLPYMILQIAIQFRTNHSISLTSDFLSKQLELFLHEIELSYNKLKYIIWLIPSLGFMGTVYGIGLAVSELGSGSLEDPNLLTNMAGSLGIAFNTTLLALILSVILQYFTQLYEAKEEETINGYGQYILENLINKLVETTK